MLLGLKSKVIWNLILEKYVGENKYMKLFKYNKKHQFKYGLSLYDYKYFIPIKIELIPIEQNMLSREKNYFINFKLKRKNYDIYFNDSNEIIKKDYFTRKDKVYKIRINIKHERKDEDLSELFYISENNIDSRYNCIKEINFIRFFDKSIEDMSYMFYKCSSLTKIKFSEFHSNNVKNMSHMFFGCSSLLSVELTKFNTKNVTDMSYMFSNCSSLRELDFSKFNTKNVIKMENMFENCQLLENLKNFNFKTNNVTNMSNMFKGCSFIPYIELTSFKTDKVESFVNMFKSCYGLTYIDISCFKFKNDAVVKEMFSGCNKHLKTQIRKQNKFLEEEAFQDEIR